VQVSIPRVSKWCCRCWRCCGRKCCWCSATAVVPSRLDARYNISACGESNARSKSRYLAYFPVQGFFLEWGMDISRLTRVVVVNISYCDRCWCSSKRIFLHCRDGNYDSQSHATACRVALKATEISLPDLPSAIKPGQGSLLVRPLSTLPLLPSTVVWGLAPCLANIPLSSSWVPSSTIHALLCSIHLYEPASYLITLYENLRRLTSVS
jgi:hypothetical protein